MVSVVICFGFSLSTTADGAELLVISGGIGGGVE